MQCELFERLLFMKRKKDIKIIKQNYFFTLCLKKKFFFLF